MKKTLLAMLAMAAALSAQARTIELLTNGEIFSTQGFGNVIGWSTDKGTWTTCNRSQGRYYVKPYYMNKLSILSQTVTLADFGITANDVQSSDLIVTASVMVVSEGLGSVTNNVKVYQLDTNGEVLSTHLVMDRPGPAFDETEYSLPIALNANARKLKYELNGMSFDDGDSFYYGPLFRSSSLKISVNSISFVSEGATIVTVNYQDFSSLTPPAVSRDGYRFLGYFTQTSGGVQVFDESYAPVNGSAWTPTDGASLYAHWVIESVNFSFVSENATVGSAEYQTTNSAPAAPTLSRNGDYQFLGYFTEDGLQVYDGNYQFVQSALSSLSSDTTLYAHWAVPEGSVAKLVYRGQLTLLGTDNPATDTQKYTKTMHFRVYDDESAETPIWRADNQTVTVNKDGSFVATFGDETLAALIATGAVTHVGVAIGSSGIELKPRRALRPVAAVNRALVAETAGKDPRIGNLVSENALAANNVTISRLEVAGTVTAPGAGPVEVSPVVVGERETLTLLRGDGVKVFSKNRIDLGETANVQRGQKIGSRAAPSDGFALITSSKSGTRGLRIPGVIQYCREGDWVRAPASEPDGVKVTFFPFVGK